MDSINKYNLDIQAGFVRQRRSLIVTSICLVYFESIGLKLEKLNIFGTTIDVVNPDISSFGLWIVYMYFLARYYQYFHDINDRGVRIKYEDHVWHIITKKGFSILKNIYIKEHKETVGSRYDFFLGDCKRNLYGKWYANVEINATATIEDRKENKVTFSHPMIKDNVTFEKIDMFFIRIQAFLHVCFRTRLISEYYLPFIIAIAPCILWVKNMLATTILK